MRRKTFPSVPGIVPVGEVREREAGLAASFVARRASVRVPATCANLGPGFDCIALALDLYNQFEFTLLDPLANADWGAPEIEVFGGAADIAHLALTQGGPRENLAVRAFRSVCERRGVALPRLRLRIRVEVPPSRGLGSSATAVVGGLLAANALLGEPLTASELLDLAVACEPGQHGDNVSAALLGGLVVTGARDGDDRLVGLALPVPSALRAVLFIPDMPMSTVHGRALLPAAYERHDVTFNLSRVALLLAALQTGRFELLATAMDDRVHQPYRELIFPAFQALIAAAREAGAHGACLSGGGSSVLALVTEEAGRVQAALEATARHLGVGGRGFAVGVARQGASVYLPDAASTRPDSAPSAEEYAV